MTHPIAELRAIYVWCDHQNEDWWLPADGRDPTVGQIIELYRLCRRFDVETPECLQEEEGEARAALTRWVAARGEVARG